MQWSITLGAGTNLGRWTRINLYSMSVGGDVERRKERYFGSIKAVNLSDVASQRKITKVSHNNVKS